MRDSKGEEGIVRKRKKREEGRDCCVGGCKEGRDDGIEGRWNR